MIAGLEVEELDSNPGRWDSKARQSPSSPCCLVLACSTSALHCDTDAGGPEDVRARFGKGQASGREGPLVLLKSQPRGECEGGKGQSTDDGAA